MRVTAWTRIAARYVRSRGIVFMAIAFAIGMTWAHAGFEAAMLTASAAIPVVLVLRVAVGRELARLPKLHADAHARGDADALAQVRSIWVGLMPSGPRADALSRALEAEELTLREKWTEARDVFATIDLAKLPAPYALGTRNFLAHTTARAGDAGRALEIVDEAIAKAKADGGKDQQAYLPHLEATRAMALVMVGRASEALPSLEQAVTQTIHDRGLNHRFYWLGMAHAAVGHEDAARDAFERASQLAGPFTAKAREALAARTPFRG